MKTSLFAVTLQWMWSPLTGIAALLGSIGKRQAASGNFAPAAEPPQLPGPPAASSASAASDSQATFPTNTPSAASRPSPPSPPPSASPASPIQHTLPSPPSPSSPPHKRPQAQQPPPAMASEASLRQTLQSLASADPSSPQTTALLSTAKKQLMQLDALIPSAQTAPSLLPLARAALEAGALLSIAAQDPDAFTRYYMQLGPFYALPESAYQPAAAAREHQRSKITGLYLLLLLTKGDYAGFHTLLEGLQSESPEEGQAGSLQGDKFIRYPVELEQALMEGAYDRVWKATKGEGVPSKEFGVFSEVLIGTIRKEIASCSEKAYPSIPVVNAKNLLFLDSEGGVVRFAQERGWAVRDGRIYFPAQGEGVRSEKEILVASGTVIENTIGYARELETIV